MPAGNCDHEDAYLKDCGNLKLIIIFLNAPHLINQSYFETKGWNRDYRINKLLPRQKMRYWYLKQNVIGNFILKTNLILDFLIKNKVIADGQPTKQIRFYWIEIWYVLLTQILTCSSWQVSLFLRWLLKAGRVVLYFTVY